MDVFIEIQESLANILDMDKQDIAPESYLVRELDVESIDLLELAVVLNSKFGIEIIDDEIFLRELRIYLMDADENESDTENYLQEKYPFLAKERINEILKSYNDGPVLKVKDLVSYVEWRK